LIPQAVCSEFEAARSRIFWGAMEVTVEQEEIACLGLLD
jgi:hypothetical protein